MSKLPPVSGRDCVKALARVGFEVKRREGSLMILRRPNPYDQVVVPDHKELDRGTRRSILRFPGLGVDDFVRLLS